MTTLDLDRLHLYSGGHAADQGQFCLLEAAARLAGEPHTDHPTCVSQVLASAGRTLNDAIKDQAERDALKDCLPLMLNTAGDGLDEQRSALAWAWVVNVYVPTWLRLAGLETEAQACQDADAGQEGRTPAALATARTKAAAAWDAAGAAAWDAARDAAWDAAWDAAGAAGAAEMEWQQKHLIEMLETEGENHAN